MSAPTIPIQGDTYLHDNWVLYFHDPNNESWTQDSYERVAVLQTVEEYVQIEHILRRNFHKGMFFLMREHIFPLWDDENNVQGGCFAIKVIKSVADDFWIDTCTKAISETLVKDPTQLNFVNGISISPKKHFCIIKVWVSHTDLQDPSILDVCDQKYGDIIFKTHA
jgi:hypothetical protein